MLLALIRKELRALSRDLHGLVALFVLPIVFIIIMSMALKDVYSPRINNLAWAVVDLDEKALSTELVKHWEIDNGKPVELPGDWKAALLNGEIQYVVLLQSGAAADLAKIAKPDQQRIYVLTEPGIDFGIFASLRAQLQASITSLRLGRFMGNLPESYMQSLGLASMPDSDAMSGAGIAKAERLSAGSRPTSVQHNVPAWLIFGMFFVVTTIAGLFVEERSCGALSRLQSLGANPLTLLIAKVFPFVLINGLQAVLMLAVGIYLIPLLGGDALSIQGVDVVALLTMLLSISLAAICLALLVATLVRSQAQAAAIGPMLNILMAALGGIMVPTFVMPATMQKLSEFSPMSWALEGLLDVLLRGGGLESIHTEVAQLLLLALVCICLAYARFRVKGI